MTPEAQAKTSRMCDAALENIQGIADDMGIEEAINVYRAQTTAFVIMLANRISIGTTSPAKIVTTKLVLDLLEALP